MQNVWIIWSPLLFFNLKSSTEPNYSPSITFQCSLHDSGVLISQSWNFYKLNMGDLTFWGNQFCRMSKLFRPPFLYFNLKSSMDPNSSSFIRFQWIMHDSGVLFWEPWYFYKLKTADLISGGNQFCRMSELLGPRFIISILKVF